VMNADGSGVTRLTNDSSFDTEPTWSPNGMKIAFVSYRDGNSEIYTMNADGSGQTNITNNGADDRDPNWSPDGQRIVFASNRDGDPFEIYTMNANGTGVTRLTNNTGLDREPAWSPDGKKITFAASPDPSFPECFCSIYVMNADGSNRTRLTANNIKSQEYPDWQPIPTAPYPHPQSAPSIHASLVPAFRQCGTSQNPATGSHAPPLAVGSCAPNPTATQAVIGPNGTAEDVVQVQASPADWTLTVAASDIRTPAGADYNPNGTGGNDLLATFRVRFTDRSNCLGSPCSTPYDKPATTTDLDFPPAHIDCVPNGDPATPPGSDCNVATSANTLVPGAVVAGKQTILQVFRVRVLNDVGSTVFLQQGVFIP
jgi:hypothetical protein